MKLLKKKTIIQNLQINKKTNKLNFKTPKRAP